MQKINFIIHFFLTILHFKGSCTLVGWQHFGTFWDPNLCQICWWSINNDIYSFLLDYFQEKLTCQNFSKHPKSPILGPYWAFLAQIWTKMNFSAKRALSVFQYLNYLPLCQKSQKPNEPFLRKLLDGHTKNQFIPLISLCDTVNFRVLSNLIDLEHFWSYLRNQNFPKYDICSSIQQLQ